MTRAERAKLCEGIRLIMAEVDDFHGGMTLLYELAGLEYPIAKLLKDPSMKSVTLAEIAKGPNQPFSYVPRDTETETKPGISPERQDV